MEKQRFLRSLKLSFLILLSSSGHGQGWEELKTIDLRDTPTCHAIDIQGNLFLGFSDGRLSKLDPSGKLLENFSFSNNSSIKLIDVQNNLRPFIFYFDNQQITILDRFSSVPKNYRLADFGIQIGMMACPAPDKDFWVVENNPQRLKKINPLRKSTVVEVQIHLGDSIKRMMAYQNILLVGDENGLNIFDQFGASIQTLDMENLTDFQISAGILYAFTAESIYQINPFKGTIISKMEIPIRSDKIAKISAGYLTIVEDKLTFYKLSNSK